jgi:hypothetical protein
MEPQEEREMLVPRLTLSLWALSSKRGEVNHGFRLKYFPSKRIDPATSSRTLPALLRQWLLMSLKFRKAQEFG